MARADSLPPPTEEVWREGPQRPVPPLEGEGAPSAERCGELEAEGEGHLGAIAAKAAAEGDLRRRCTALDAALDAARREAKVWPLIAGLAACDTKISQGVYSVAKNSLC